MIEIALGVLVAVFIIRGWDRRKLRRALMQLERVGEKRPETPAERAARLEWQQDPYRLCERDRWIEETYLEAQKRKAEREEEEARWRELDEACREIDRRTGR